MLGFFILVIQKSGTVQEPDVPASEKLNLMLDLDDDDLWHDLIGLYKLKSAE